MPFGRWGEMLSDDVVAAATIDRLVHHAEVLTLTGDSTAPEPAAHRAPYYAKAHGRLSSQWLPAVYLLAVAARGDRGVRSAAEPVTLRTPYPHMAS